MMFSPQVLITAYLYSARCMIFIGPRTDHSLSLSQAYPCLEDLNHILDYDRPVVHIFDADFVLRLLHYKPWSVVIPSTRVSMVGG